jgi:hypothetical protein
VTLRFTRRYMRNLIGQKYVPVLDHAAGSKAD